MKRGTVAIVGRPNVGKSTLFNRILGGRPAIVDDRPGVTRDRNFAPATWGGMAFWLVDTGGLVTGSPDPMQSAIQRQVAAAIDDADVIIFVVDTQIGVHPADLDVAQSLRPHKDRVLVAANKADELATDVSYHAFHELGLGTPQPVSAATGKGSGDLLDRLVSLLPPGGGETTEDTIHVAVIGPPNVGKSSLVNRILGVERLVVAAEAGTTRDSIDTPLRYEGKTLNFIDTAGLRKRSKVEDEIEFYATLRTRRAMERADVCVVVVDATRGIRGQDLRIANEAWELGTGLMVAVNKWDLIPEKDALTAKRGQDQVTQRAPFLGYVPFEYVSATTGQRIDRIAAGIVNVAENRAFRVPTAALNKRLQELVAKHQPPQAGGREVKLLYASQIGERPPTFAIVTNEPKGLDESYRRYLERGLRDRWNFEGAPIRLKFRRKRGRQ